MTCGSSRSLDVAGSFSLFACSSSTAAASIDSRKRDTSSSAYLSNTSSSSLLFLFARELLDGFRMASICRSNLILFAAPGVQLSSRVLPGSEHGPRTNFRRILAQVNLLRSPLFRRPFLLARCTTLLISPSPLSSSFCLSGALLLLFVFLRRLPGRVVIRGRVPTLGRLLCVYCEQRQSWGDV